VKIKSISYEYDSEKAMVFVRAESNDGHRYVSCENVRAQFIENDLKVALEVLTSDTIKFMQFMSEQKIKPEATLGGKR
jgi:hypothetical protein